MFIQRLRLLNFKNYAEADITFSSPVVCLLGANGSGKTNLLDAIHYLSMTKSALNPADAQNVRLGENHFMIRGDFQLQDKAHEVICSYQTGQKKTLREDGIDYAKFSEHVGRYPIVLVAPQDIELIWGASEVRRRFMDAIISQLDRRYLEDLITYMALLKQRNAALKLFADQGRVDHDLLSSYDAALTPLADRILTRRQQFLAEFVPEFIKRYKTLSQSPTEAVELVYRSELQDTDFASLLADNLRRDLALQRTSAGIHRDEFLFLLNGHEIKKFGSQGQQKSFLMALKLAELEVITRHKGFRPLLLLDDIFDKLDDQRINLLLEVIRHDAGQVFITDARPDRCLQLLKDAELKAAAWRIETGKCVPWPHG